MLKHKEDDIRRRLTIAEVPKPPADLVQKIKHDIPKHFTSMTAKEVEKKPRETSPLWNFWGFSWQLAAAILVLVGLTWAVLDTWQSEMNEAARIAEADRDAISVDEFEAKVTAEDDVVRVEGAAPVAAPSSDDAPAAAPKATAPTEGLAFAPEPARKAQQARAAQTAPAQVTARREETPTATTRQAARRADAGSELEDTTEATTRTAVAKEAETMAAAAPAAPAAPAPLHAGTAERNEAAREVVVKGLATEALVTVEVTLDASGKVIDLRIPGTKDEAVIEAVTAAAKTWAFPPSRDDAGRSRLTRTLEVQLRRGE